MRIIKFRAWGKLEKEMWRNFLIDATGKNEIWLFAKEGLRLQANEAIDADDIILMQYTGLKDKKGKEIYEGDIVHLGAYNNCQKKWLPTYKCEVKFTLEHGGYTVSTPYTDNHFNDFEAKYCEVIGNIYSNPELLEEK